MGKKTDFLLREHSKFNRVSNEICGPDLNCRYFFEEMIKVKNRHQQMEEEIVFPLYRHLVNRLSGEDPRDINELNSIYEMFTKFQDRLLEDHNVIRKILNEAKAQTYRIEVINAVDEMLEHMALEEDLIYPSISTFWKMLDSPAFQR